MLVEWIVACIMVGFVNNKCDAPQNICNAFVFSD